MGLIEVALIFVGGWLVMSTLFSAVRSFVVPRSDRVLLTSVIFRAILQIFRLRLRFLRDYESRDRLMSIFAPLSLLVMPFVWFTLITIGFMLIYWAIGIRPWYDAFLLSGSSLLTLGFAPVVDWPTTILAFIEATIGLGMVALLIAYLPTMYSAFSRRETFVTMLDVRAGSPPSAVEMIERFQRIHTLDRLSELWRQWEIWFVELEESHTSLAPLVLFRSPHSDQAWVNAAGAILDAAALHASTLDVPRDPQADLCIRAGFIALRNIADFFGIPYDPNPAPDDPITIPREEYDAVYDRFLSRGIPLKPDREQAWRDYRGWRVNYDGVLYALADLTMTPVRPDLYRQFDPGKTRRRQRAR